MISKYKSLNYTKEDIFKRNRIDSSLLDASIKEFIEYQNKHGVYFLFWDGQSIGVIDGDYKVFISYTTYYEGIRKETTSHKITFIILNTKTNFFVINDEIKIKGSSKIYLSDDELYEAYLANKDELLKQPLGNSIINLFHSYTYSLFERNNCYECHVEILASLHPFIRKNISSCQNEKQLFYLLQHFLFPISKLMVNDRHFIYDLVDRGDTFISNLVKETSNIKRINYLLPLANKETIQLLKNVLDCKNKVLSLPNNDSYISLNNFDLNICNIFSTTEKLNEFLKNVHSYADNNRIFIISKPNNEFFEKTLPLFFTSRKKYEDELIQFLKINNEQLALQAIEDTETFNLQLEKYKNEECTCNFDKNEKHKQNCYYNQYYEENIPVYEGSYSMLQLYLTDIRKMFFEIKKIQNTVQDEKVKKYISIIFEKKFDSIQELHDEFAYFINSVEEFKINFDTNDLSYQELEQDDYSLKPVLDNVSLKQIGLKMHHCVGSYQSRILDKKTSIYYVLNKKTNEYTACLEYDHVKKAIIQAKSNYNRKITNAQTLHLIKNFVEMNQIKVLTNDL